MNKRKKNKLSFGNFFLAFILFSIAPPLGVIFVLYIIGVFDQVIDAFKGNRANSGSAESRYARYMVYTDYSDSVSLRFLSSALDIPYTTVVRDISKMITEKRFGRGAYIDYANGTLILSERAKPQQTKQTQTATPGKSTPVKTTAKKNEKENKSFRPVACTVLLISAILMLLGAIGLISEAAQLAQWDIGYAEELVTGISFALGGIAALVGRGSIKRRGRRYRKYSTITKGKASFDLNDLASQAGVTVSALIRDLEDMIERGMLGEDAYIDSGRMLLIIDPKKAPKQEEKPAAQETGTETKQRYDAILAKIRKLDDDIADEAVSERIREIERLTGSIFQIVQENPDKLPQIKSFLSYYLPTTLKLLDSYAVLERQGVGGENISSAKERIENILDSLVGGFSQQLDQLFKSDVLDISTDIDVLESMMAKDGLTGDKSGFKTATRGGT